MSSHIHLDTSHTITQTHSHTVTQTHSHTDILGHSVTLAHHRTQALTNTQDTFVRRLTDILNTHILTSY